MENNETQYQYKYDNSIDILLKSEDGRKWFYIHTKKDGQPYYTDYEKKILEREREIYEEAQERWTEEYIKMMDDPDYWENYFHQNEEFMSDEEKEIVLDLSGLEVEKQPRITNRSNTCLFPIDALPYGVREIVKDGNRAFDVAYDFFALPVLAACGTAIGSKFEVAINDSMSTKPIIYGCLIAVAGGGKSPAQNISMKPIYTLQNNASDTYKEDLKKYQLELNEYEEKERKARQDKQSFTEEPPNKPKLKEFYTTDSTIEAMARILEKNPNGIIYVNDEFLGFYNSLNSYRSGKGSDLQQWLTLWNGNDLKINRRGDDIPLIVTDPFVSIVGNMTPSGIKVIAQNSNTENGFLDRFLFSYPTDSKAFNPAKANGINKDIEHTYFNLIKSLVEMETSKDKKYIKLSDEAIKVYKDYFDRTTELAGDDEKLRSIVAKLHMYSLRFGLIIHLCEFHNPQVFHKHKKIQKESMLKAVKLCDYFFAQAEKIYDKLAMSESDELTEKAISVLKKKATRNGDCFTISKRELQRGLKIKSDLMKELTNDLLEKEILGVKEEGNRGSVIYFIDPSIMQ